MAEDLRHFIEANRLGPVVLVGHSLGGRAAMATALTYPGLVDRLVVVDMSPDHINLGLGGSRAVALAMAKMPVELMRSRVLAQRSLPPPFDGAELGGTSAARQRPAPQTPTTLTHTATTPAPASTHRPVNSHHTLP